MQSSQLYLITSTEEPEAAWDALKNISREKHWQTSCSSRKMYFRMEMQEGACMQQHLKNMKEVTDKLAATGAPIAEEDQVVALL